jgi:Mn2+/Fe2+ NRAMP family transporter
MWRKLKRFWQIAGPGVITGAADDDPSGIATYSQTGAQFGYAQLWLMPIMLPMMIVLQEICARIGIVTGKGIAGVVREHYPKSVLYAAVVLMLIANIINLGADLGAMAAAAQLSIPLPYILLVGVFGLVSLALQLFISYTRYARFLKWLTISLFAYVLTGFIVSQNWREVLLATFVPNIRFSFQYLMIFVGLLGTTFSPYLFFWQASQEVEEVRANGKLPTTAKHPSGHGPRPAVGPQDIRNMRIDTWSGMVFSQIAAWFVVVTAAGSLHAAAITNVATAADAAKALAPRSRANCRTESARAVPMPCRRHSGATAA